jgi:hypothetical protein
MRATTWILRRSAGDRHGIDRPLLRATDIDAWLDTVHRLASGRAAERVELAPAGSALRARLRAKSG